MMHNNFGRDAFRVVPRQGCVRVIRKVRQSLEQLARAVGWACEPPEVGRTLERHTHDIVVGAIAPMGILFLRVLVRVHIVLRFPEHMPRYSFVPARTDWRASRSHSSSINRPTVWWAANCVYRSMLAR